MSDDKNATPTLKADREACIGRIHVESEQSLASVLEFEKTSFEVPGFVPAEAGQAQWLSGDAATGACTQRVVLKKGWTAPIGHFTSDVEIFVLTGKIRHGGFQMRNLTYAFIPEGIPVGPWETDEETVLLWMPDRKIAFETQDYASLPQIPENATYHKRAQTNPRMVEMVSAMELASMPWESTTFLPPGSARKSLYTNKETGRATWVLGLVPMWIEGNFIAGHPTAEEAYCIRGDIAGHWSMADAPFERRYATMEADGYYWRPAHVPHGPFWTEAGALLLFRTQDRLDCHWTLHNPDFTQRDGERLKAAQSGSKK